MKRSASQMSRTPYKPTPFKRPRIKANAITMQSKRTGGYAGRGLNPEKKFLDTTPGGDPPVSAAFSAAVLLNGCIPGSLATERIGRKITMTSIWLRYSYALAATSVGGSPLRILVVYDKQANGAVPAIGDILRADAFTATNNLSNRDRFVTLIDEVSQPIAVSGEFQVCNEIYRKINLEAMFNAGTAGTVADITSGSIHMFVAQAGGITVAAPDFVSNCRIRYTDL